MAKEDSGDAGPDWSQLPDDLLIRILSSLGVPDLIRSGCVCWAWNHNYQVVRRFSLCSPNQPPFLLYSSADRDAHTATLHDLCNDKPYHITFPGLSFRRCFPVGSSHGWLAVADEQSVLYLINPITGTQIALPPLEYMENVRLCFNSYKEYSGYSFRSLDLSSRSVNKKNRRSTKAKNGRYYFYLRIALSCDPSRGNCVALIMHWNNYQLSFARVGSTKWTWIDVDKCCCNYCDFFYSNNDGLFYAVRRNGDVHTIDLNGPTPVVKIIFTPTVTSFPVYLTYKYILRAPWGDLLQVWRLDGYLNDDDDKRRTIKIIVYKMDLAEQKLVELKKLQDYALFLGFNNSFFLSVRDDFPMLIPNSIYLTDHGLEYFGSNSGQQQVIVFNMEDDSFTDLLPSDSRLNWPPPTWFRPSYSQEVTQEALFTKDLVNEYLCNAFCSFLVDAVYE